MADELVEEVLVLQAIYDHALHYVEAEATMTIALDTDAGPLSLVLALPHDYPSSPPQIDVFPTHGPASVSNRIILHDLLKDLRHQATELVGTVMAFSLCTHLQDWVSKAMRHSASTVRLPTTTAHAPTATATVIEQKVLTEGTPVTRDTFMAWRDSFAKEHAALPSAAHAPASRLTGKQLFEQNRALATSDGVLADDEDAVEIDLSAFHNINLDDLDLDSDDFEDRLALPLDATAE